MNKMGEQTQNEKIFLDLRRKNKKAQFSFFYLNLTYFFLFLTIKMK